MADLSESEDAPVVTFVEAPGITIPMHPHSEHKTPLLLGSLILIDWNSLFKWHHLS